MPEPPLSDDLAALAVALAKGAAPPETAGVSALASLSAILDGAEGALAGTRSSRYELLAEIGRGGMGVVWSARDTDLKREVAFKVLQGKHQGSGPMLRRFVNEARITGRLQHPGILPVYDVGLFADGRPYLVLKLVRGRTLAALLAERPSSSANLSHFLSIFEEVCQAVAYAHSKGVFHRDLKPANVMVGDFGEVQVMDWGLAKGVERPAPGPERVDQVVPASPSTHLPTPVTPHETGAGSVLGTPAYMAPEQARGEIDMLDERSDVFSLGAVLCEILTGQPPYIAPDERQVAHKAAGADLGGAWRRLEISGADEELRRLARACLSPAPGERPRHAGELAVAVSTYRAGIEGRLRAAELARKEAEVKATEQRKRRRLQAALFASVLLAAVGIGGVWLWFDRDRAARDAEHARKEVEAARLFAGYVNLGYFLSEQGKLKEAEEVLGKAVELDPQNALAHYNLGLNRQRRGDHAAAVLAYQKAVELKPDFAEARNNRGNSLTALGRHTEAVEAFEKALASRPGYARAHFNLGYVLDQQGKIDEAIASYRRAIEHNPAYAEAYYQIAWDLLYHKGRFAEARDELRRGRKFLSPGDPARSNWDRLLQECERLLALEPRLNAYLKGASGPDAAEACDLALLCSWAHRRLYGDATRLYERAFAAEPARALDLRMGYRYHAATCAARAGCGQGTDTSVEPGDRERWRGLALAWLRADLVLREKQITGGDDSQAREARQKLNSWKVDPNLACVYDPKALARLPEAERAAWRRLWGEVHRLRGHSRPPE
jgi:serine/threonine protein kinase